MNDYAYRNPLIRTVAKVIDTIGGILLRPKKTAPGSVSRVVLFRLDQIGDAFYFTPTLDYLAEQFPGVQIDIVTTSRCAPIFENHPALGEIHVFNYGRFARGGATDGFKEWLSLVKKLCVKKFDVAIDPRGEPTVALTAWLASIPVRIGIAHEEVLSFTYTHPVRYNPSSPAWHRFQSILRELEIEASTWKPRIVLTKREEIAAKKIANRLGKFIALHLGAGVPFKRWPIESYAGVARAAVEWGFRVAIFGTQEEAPQTRELSSLGTVVEDFTGKLSVRSTYALFRYASAFVGNDSAPVHLAAAQDIPTVHLLSSASPASASALGANVAVVTGQNPAHVCSLDRCPYPCPHMEAITAENVTDALDSMLS